MTRPTNPITGQAPTRALAGMALTLALALLPAGNLRADAPPASLHIVNTGPDTEGLPTFRLDWDASSNATYLVQSAGSLAPGATWNTLDAVKPADKAGSYRLQVVATDSTGLSSPPATFYRLILPQPQISSVEPAIVAPGVAVDIYVLGQCFSTDTVLTINGVTQSDATIQSSTMMVKPSFTPDLPGNYQFSLVAGGQVVSSFNVVCADALANPGQVLQGPPTEPPATPSKKDFKGHVTLLKAFDDAAGGTESKKDFKGHVTLLKAFDDEDGDASSARGHTKTGHVTLMKAFDDAAGDSEAKKDFKGHVTLLKAFDDEDGDASGARGHTKTGHVTLMKAFDDGGDDARARPGRGRPLSITVTREFAAGNASVMPFSGEVQECDVDMAIPGRGLDFVWARTYRSRINHTATVLGNCWSLSYDVSVAPSSAGYTMSDGTGRRDTYTLGTNGTYACPEFFREGTLSNNTFTLTFADTGRWVFNPFDGTAAAGRLFQIITRNGDTMTLGYDPSGRLAQIVDDLGRTNTVAYNPAGQVASVTDFTGRSVTYQYYQGLKGEKGGAGDLKSVTSPPVTGTPNGNDFPDGKTTTYTYSSSFPLDRENHLLLTVTDPKNQTAAVFSYEHNPAVPNYLRCIAAQEGTNPPGCFNWVLVTRPAGSYATTRCIVNDPVGNVSESFFDARNRCVIERDYTGRAAPGLPVTDMLNRPTGQLRSTDPAFYETRWNWNNDSLCTLAVTPGGQQMQYVYQTDFDPATSARKRADCRVMRELASTAVDLNGDGVADVTDRAWYYTYDARFGSNPSARKDMLQWIKNSFDGLVPDGNGMAIKTKGTGADKNRVAAGGGPRPKGWDGTIKGLVVPDGNGVAIKTKGTGADPNRNASVGGFEDRWPMNGDPDFNDFCVSATDPRGIVTTSAYNAQGSMVWRLRKRPELLYQQWDESFAYDAYGQLTTITNAADANGYRRKDMLTWLQGQVAQCVVDAGGVALTTAFEYDARGNLTRYADPRANDWRFIYNTLDQCVRAQTPTNLTSRCTTDFSYDANDNLVQSATEVRDAVDNLAGTQVNRASYDGLDRLSEIALAVDASHALTNRFVYDGNDQCVQVLGGDAVSGADPHQAVANEYDERGLLFRSTAAPGTGLCATNEFGYDANGNTASSHLIEGLTTLSEEFAYDGFGRLDSATDPMGNQTVCFLDANDNPKVVRLFGEINDVPGSAGNVRLAESRYDYDSLDRCVVLHELHFNPATQTPVGDGEATTRLALCPNGQCSSITNDLGHTTIFGYDTAGRLTSASSPEGKTAVVAVRDAFGNITSSMQTDTPDLGGPPQVFSVTNVYDALNRCISSTDSAGNTGSCAYDSLDRGVQTIDPRGVHAFYSYDLLDRCTMAIGDLNGDGLPDFARDITTTFTWSSSSGNLLAMTDSQTNTTSYDYDSLGRCTAIHQADGTQQKQVWSPRSNLVREEDANGTVITNTYDLDDNIVHRDIAARTAAGVAATTTFETFTHDGSGRMTGETDDASDGTFAYDSLGNCVRETLNGLSTTSTYDALGNRLSLAYPGGRTLAYAYDSNERCTSITNAGAMLASFNYAGLDRVARRDYGNGTRTQIAYDGLAGLPNAAGDHGFGQVSRALHDLPSKSLVIDDRTFGYDPDQNQTARDMTSPFTLGGAAQAMSFQYDPAGRLVNSLVTTNGEVARLVDYGLDRMGNRTNVAGAVCSGDYSMSATAPPADFQMNQYTTTPCDARTYDDNGNLVGISSPVRPVTCQYDFADRLVQVQSVDFSGGAPVISTSTYAYDSLGRRVSKTVSSGGLPPVTTLFLYDGDSVIEERSGGLTAATYVASPCNGAGEYLAMNRSGQDYYFHTDDQGNVLALTTTGGAVVERYDYDDYGTVTFLTGDGTPTGATASSVGNVYCWGGLRLDTETGLHNNDGGDYFEPQTGRAVRGKVKTLKDMGSNGRADDGNNPWSGGGGEMQKGTVKFFNETKGFGIVVGGGSKTHTKTGHVTLMK